MFAEHGQVPRLKTRNYYIFVLKYLHLHKIRKINLLLVKKKRMYLAKIIFIRFNLKNDKVKAKAIYNSRKKVLDGGLGGKSIQTTRTRVQTNFKKKLSLNHFNKRAFFDKRRSPIHN